MKKPANRLDERILLCFLVMFGLCLAFYFTFRYGGTWIENDSAVLTGYITAMQREGDLTPDGATYQHGFLFQALSVLISDLSGITISSLQRLIFPFLSITILVISAWYFFNQATNDTRQTALAVLLLCLQGDVLFVIFRGSHEKLDWPLIMLSLGLLFNSYKQGGKKLIVCIALFYLLAFAQVSVNIFFATTFLTAILLSMVTGRLIQFIKSRRSVFSGAEAERLLYITLSVSIIAFLFISYIYPPALNNLHTMENIFQKLVSLLVNPALATRPYDYISIGWINNETYLSLSTFTWLLIFGSMGFWIKRGWRLINGQEPFRLKNQLDWLLYTGFAFQVGASMVIDLSGALGKNLQLRVFPGFTVVAVLILSKGLLGLLPIIKLIPVTRKALSLVMVFFVAWLPVAAVLKASNEPILSNQWMIYSESEVEAVDWAIEHLEQAQIWTGIDNRIMHAFNIERGTSHDKILVAFSNFENIRHVVLSQKEVLRATRIGFSLPPTFGWMTLYDNGEVQVFKKPPVTPFQK